LREHRDGGEQTGAEGAVAEPSASKEAPHAALLQRKIQRRAIQRKEDETKKGGAEKAKEASPEAGYPKVATVGTEKVKVANAQEEADAKKFIDTIKNDYGIDVSSLKTVDAIKDWYDEKEIPDGVRDAIKTREWEFKELKALKLALDHYAPILGKNREKSSRKGVAQEVTSVGVANNSITSHDKNAKVSGNTLGQYFKQKKNFGMFDPGTNSTVDFKDNMKQLEGTAIHEIAHGLMASEYDNFVAKGSDGFWTDQETESKKNGAEKPPTPYGKTNAREDLCESVMYYFVAESTLKGSSPLRHAFLKKLIDSWSEATPIDPNKVGH
jgi:hypothetical protein